MQLGGAGTGGDAALPGEHVWSQRFGDASFESATHLATSSTSDRFYVAGRFSGDITIGDQTLTSPGGSLSFVAAFNHAGEPQWARNTGDSFIGGLAVDSDGGLLVSAQTFSTLNWGSQPGDEVACCEQLLVGRFDSTGELEFTMTESGFLPNSAIRPSAVVSAPGGGSIVAGVFDRDFTLGANALVADDGEDVWVAELSPTGGVTWAVHLGGDGDEALAGVARDDSGNIYLVGHFDGTMSAGTETVSTTSSAALFVAKLSPTGAPLGLVRFETTLTAQEPRPWQGQRVVVVGDGDGILLGGSFDTALDLGSGSLPYGGDTDGFVARIGEDLVADWSVSFGGTQDQFVHGIAQDSAGDIWVAATIQGTFDVAGATLASQGDDLLLARIDSATHTFNRAQHFPSAENQRASGVGVAGGVVFWAEGQGSVDFGGGALNSLGGADAFLAGFGAP